MRTTARTSFSLLMLALAVVALGLTACDQSEQNVDWRAGESLAIVGPTDSAGASIEEAAGGGQGGTATSPLFAPAIATTPQAYFRVKGHSRDQSYSWFVDGEEVEPVEGSFGEFMRYTFEEPGTYTVAVETDQYRGEQQVIVAYPGVGVQAGRYGFSTFGTALDAAGLVEALSAEGPFTVFVPTNEAFVAALDTTAGGALNLPAPSVLADILQYHVVSDSLPAPEIDDSDSPETLAGGEITFNVMGDAITVEDGTDLTEEPATVTQADVPTSNGVVHAIDEVLFPPTASVAFNAQATTGDSVTVRSVYVPRDGYVAIHDSTLLDDPPQVTGSVIGVSEYLEAGLYNNLDVPLFEVPGADFDEDMTLDGDQLLIAMPHEETNGNETYDFVASDGSEDGAYTEDGGAVTDDAEVTVEE